MPPFSLTLSADSLEQLGELAVHAGRRLQAQASEVAVAAEAAPEKAAKPARSRAAPAAAPRVDTGPTALPAPAVPVATDGEALKKQAIATIVKLINANDALGHNGKQVCTDLCLSFGGANVSKIDPAKYPDLIKAAEKAIDSLNDNPAG